MCVPHHCVPHSSDEQQGEAPFTEFPMDSPRMEQDFNLVVSKRPDPVEEILSSWSLKHHPFACHGGSLLGSYPLCPSDIISLSGVAALFPWDTSGIQTDLGFDVGASAVWFSSL